MKAAILSIFMVLVSSVSLYAEGLSQHLQDISVTIHSEGEFKSGQGSGVIVTRNLKLNNASDERANINFVLTAAHVVDNLRSIRTTVDPTSGQDKKVIEYMPVFLVKELVENGRKVGETRMEAKVLKFSDSETGHDLALLMVLKHNFISSSAKFYLQPEIPEIGTRLFHVGSLLGQDGSNSMTTGIVSQIGRVLNLQAGNSPVFDQTTVTAFPGSSGF